MPDVLRAGILCPVEERPPLSPELGAQLRDLNLDQIVDALTAGREEYDLGAWFRAPLRTVAAVAHRQDVLDDLREERALQAARAFAAGMREVRLLLGRTGPKRYAREADGWFLQAAETYCEAAARLAEELGGAPLRSAGMRAFLERLRAYLQADAFAGLAREARAVRAALAEVRYSVNVRANRVTVGRQEDEEDWGEEVRRTFRRFERGADAEYAPRWSIGRDMDHVEARVLDLVARLYPEPFGALAAFRDRHDGFVDALLAGFDREAQFYLAFLDLIAPLHAAGLPFSRPVVVEDGDVLVREGFDLALALKLSGETGDVVRNDLELRGRERIAVVTGPNQGGKTTFARMTGQLHHLAALGLLVPAAEARIRLPEVVLTHFERAEAPASTSGKLEDDLLRIHAMLEEATARSVLILNETFSSTTLHDARVLGEAVLRQVVERGALCVYVTFVDELASLGDEVVSLVAGVRPDDPGTRTFAIERRPADGLAHARVLAQRHGLTPERVAERLA